MNEPFVLDASVSLSRALNEEADSFTENVLKNLENAHAVVSASWPFEIINTLAAAERRGRMTASQQAEFLEKLRVLPIEIERRPATWLAQ